MKIAVTGKSGQVATALATLSQPGLEVITLGRPELDLAHPSTVLAALRAVNPDLIVSAAAYTAVDKAETERAMAFLINRDGARSVAEAAATLNIPVVHLSTDYVFNGSKPTSYVEDDPTSPTSIYGQSKLAGEVAVATATANHVIVRTAWVYSPYGHNFVKTMLRLSETRDELGIVADQVGCPTSADDIALALVEIGQRLLSDSSSDLRGILHLAGTGKTSWAGFSRHIFSILETNTGRQIAVREISTAEYPTPAKRPANSVLDCSKLLHAYGIRLPDWQISTEHTVKKLLRESGQ